MESRSLDILYDENLILNPKRMAARDLLVEAECKALS